MPLPDKWIAKKIATFGRYPHTRPPGLHVDSYGALKLENLMAVWGHPQGLNRDTILQAVQNHAINDSKLVSRFTLFKDSSGNFTILVHSKSKEASQKRQLRHSSSQQGDANQADKAAGSKGTAASPTVVATDKTEKAEDLDLRKTVNKMPKQGCPSKPPGKNWTMYADGEVNWWYYEGPLGKWYMGVDDKKPQLYYDTERE